LKLNVSEIQCDLVIGQKQVIEDHLSILREQSISAKSTAASPPGSDLLSKQSALIAPTESCSGFTASESQALRNTIKQLKQCNVTLQNRMESIGKVLADPIVQGTVRFLRRGLKELSRDELSGCWNH
jgi:hypothetical protein